MLDLIKIRNFHFSETPKRVERWYVFIICVLLRVQIQNIERMSTIQKQVCLNDRQKREQILYKTRLRIGDKHERVTSMVIKCKQTKIRYYYILSRMVKRKKIDNT